MGLSPIGFDGQVFSIAYVVALPGTLVLVSLICLNSVEVEVSQASPYNYSLGWCSAVSAEGSTGSTVNCCKNSMWISGMGLEQEEAAKKSGLDVSMSADHSDANLVITLKSKNLSFRQSGHEA